MFQGECLVKGRELKNAQKGFTQFLMEKLSCHMKTAFFTINTQTLIILTCVPNHIKVS